MLTHLQYYATRNQTLGLYLPVGPWNHKIHLTFLDSSRKTKRVDRPFSEGRRTKRCYCMLSLVCACGGNSSITFSVNRETPPLHDNMGCTLQLFVKVHSPIRVAFSVGEEMHF